MSTSFGACGRDFDGTMALNAWAGRDGVIAAGDEAVLLHQPVEVAMPALGRFA